MEGKDFSGHSVILEDRKKLHASGVKEVISFDDETVLLDTALGRMTVKGEALHIVSFNTETGDLQIEGKLHAFVYMADSRSSGGFVSRLFR